MPSISRVFIASLAMLAASAAFADDLDRVQLLNQAQFRALSEDLSSAVSYKGIIPAEPLGVTGFDVGLAVSATSIRNDAAWDQASSGDAPSTLIVPTLRLHKGLPWGIDLGAELSKIPGTNIGLFGGELRYALLEGGVALPAVSLRGAFTRVSGVDQLKFSTQSIDLSISKGFLNFTPYGGIGQVWASSRPQVGGLEKESFTQTKYFAGLNINFTVLNLALEADKTGDANSASVKLGFRF